MVLPGDGPIQSALRELKQPGSLAARPAAAVKPEAKAPSVGATGPAKPEDAKPETVDSDK